MKRFFKIKRIINCLFFSSFFIFAACNNGLAEKQKASPDKMASISISINSIGPNVFARTIKPASSDDISTISLTGILNSSGTTTSLGSWDTVSDMEADSVSVQPGSWVFTLSLELNGCPFSGTYSADVNSDDNAELSFNLECDSTVTYGGIDFSLYMEGQGGYPTATLYDMDDNVAADPVNLAIDIANGKFLIHYTRDIKNSSERVPAGTYRLKIIFYTSTSRNVIQNRYSAIVNVTSGYISSAEQTISMNTIYNIVYGYDDSTSFPSGSFVPGAYSSISEDIILAEPEKEGYAFYGWYTTNTFDDGTEITEIPQGSSGNKTVYAYFGTPYAKVGTKYYSNLEKTVNAITNATGDIDVVLYDLVGADELGKSSTEGTIAYAIKNTSADGISLSLYPGDEIFLNEDSSNLFSNCEKLTSIDLTGFKTQDVTSMANMFYMCKGLTSLDVSGFDTSNVTNMTWFAGNSSNLETITFNEHFVTSRVTNTSYMFSGCSSLTGLDVSGFDVSGVGDMSFMFSNCKLITELDVSGFVTSSATNLSNMFNQMEKIVTLDLSNFQTSNVTQSASMFGYCYLLETIYVSNEFELTSGISSSAGMFNYCYKLVGGAGTEYSDSNKGGTYAKVDGGTDSPGYFTLKLIGEKSAPDAVGDIVYTDGSATAYTSDLELTDKQKANAIALIFYIGADCNDEGVTTDRMLGAGFAFSEKLCWAIEGVNAYNKNITTIQAAAADTGVTGDKNGSDNLSQIADFLIANSSTDDTGTAGNYPAFDYTKNYKSQTGSRVAGTDYEDNWYLPSIAELLKLCEAKSTFNAVSVNCGGSTYSDSAFYWCSNQHTSYDTYSGGLYNGGWMDANKVNTDWIAIAIREF